MKKALTLFKCLGEETRFLIIKALLSGERCACELPGLIGRTQSNTSMHLAKLLEVGILKQRRDGKRIFYSIKDEKIKKILRIVEGGEKMKNDMMEEQDKQKDEEDDSCGCGGCC